MLYRNMIGCDLVGSGVLGLEEDIVFAGENLSHGHVATRASARSCRRNIAILVNKFKVVAAQQVRDGRQLGSISCGIIIELEEWDGKEFHVLGDAKNLCDSIHC